MAEKYFVHDSEDYYDVNYLKYEPRKTKEESKNTSYLLWLASESLTFEEDISDHIALAQEEFGLNSIVWGVKNNNGIYTVEIYLYHPKIFKERTLSRLAHYLAKTYGVSFNIEKYVGDYYLLSYDIDGKAISKINIYEMKIDETVEETEFHSTGIRINVKSPLAISYVMTQSGNELRRENMYYCYFGINELYDILEKCQELAQELFPDENAKIALDFLRFQYLYQDWRLLFCFSVTRKYDAIGLYFCGLNFDNFLKFLKFHDYDSDFIERVEMNRAKLEHIAFDIGFDFYIKNNNFVVKKTSFFGTV